MSRRLWVGMMMLSAGGAFCLSVVGRVVTGSTVTSAHGNQMGRPEPQDAVPVGGALQHPDAALARAVAPGLDAAERHVRLRAAGGVVDAGHARLDVVLEGVRPLAVVGVDAAA